MKITKKDELLSWVQSKGIVSSVDVHQWGLHKKGAKKIAFWVAL